MISCLILAFLCGLHTLSAAVSLTQPPISEADGTVPDIHTLHQHSTQSQLSLSTHEEPAARQALVPELPSNITQGDWCLDAQKNDSESTALSPATQTSLWHKQDINPKVFCALSYPGTPGPYVILLHTPLLRNHASGEHSFNLIQPYTQSLQTLQKLLWDCFARLGIPNPSSANESITKPLCFLPVTQDTPANSVLFCGRTLMIPNNNAHLWIAPIWSKSPHTPSAPQQLIVSRANLKEIFTVIEALRKPKRDLPQDTMLLSLPYRSPHAQQMHASILRPHGGFLQEALYMTPQTMLRSPFQHHHRHVFCLRYKTFFILITDHTNNARLRHTTRMAEEFNETLQKSIFSLKDYAIITQTKLSIFGLIQKFLGLKSIALFPNTFHPLEPCVARFPEQRTKGVMFIHSGASYIVPFHGMPNVWLGAIKPLARTSVALEIKDKPHPLLFQAITHASASHSHHQGAILEVHPAQV